MREKDKNMPTVAYLRYSLERLKSPQESIYLPEAASQSFLAGELVIVHTDGTVKRPVATGTQIAVSDCGNGAVIALQAASGTTGADVQVALIGDNTELFLPICTSSGTAAGTYVASSAAMVGDKYTGLNVTASTSGGYFNEDQIAVDTATTANPIFRVIKFDRKEAIGTTGNVHYAWVQVLVAARFRG